MHFYKVRTTMYRKLTKRAKPIATFRVKQETYDFYDAMARRMRVSISDVMRNALEDQSEVIKSQERSQAVLKNALAVVSASID